MRSLAECKYGMFVHYVPECTVDRAGKPIMDINTLADSFCVEEFADSVSRMGFEYIIFTAWHFRCVPLFPSKTQQHWRPDSVCRRDLLGELLTACEKRGIGVVFYTHPRDGHDFLPADQRATGWGEGSEPGKPENPDWSKFRFAQWNDYIQQLYKETVERYGSRLLGLWLDEGSAAGDSYRVVDYPALAAALKRLCPGLMLMNNFYGDGYGLDASMKEYFIDWGAFADRTGMSWPAYEKAVGAVVTHNWMTSEPEGTFAMTMDADAIFRYSVLQAAVNRQGAGTAWAAGPYPDEIKGNVWETGVLETLSLVGNRLKALGSAFFGTRPSEAFPTVSGTDFRSLSYGVSMTSGDRSIEYVHLLKDSGRTIRLGQTKNGARFQSAALPDGTPVAMEQSAEGVTLTLPCDWQAPDTVVMLRVEPGSYGARGYTMYNQTDPAAVYTGCWQRDYHDRVLGDFEGDVALTETDGARVTFLFCGSRAELIAPCFPGGGSLRVFLDGTLRGDISLDAPAYQAQNEVFDSGKLYAATHRLRVERVSGTVALDAFRVYD